jgi:uncharacterized membrane protein YphA (DoxX/SURF4 family)
MKKSTRLIITAAAIAGPGKYSLDAWLKRPGAGK